MNLKNRLLEADAIIRETRQLRLMQTEYFRFRDYDQLKKCKIQEKKLDGMIDNYDKGNQRKLF